MTAPSAPDTDLTSLKARALKAYATKDYPLSADLYAQACEVQSQANGDEDPKNAHLLYLYGRSLYKVAQAKSDVLGGGAAAEKETAPAKPSSKKPLEEVVEEEAVGEQALKKDGDVAKGKGLFSFQGDENWDDEEEAEAAAEGEGEDGEEAEEDDMTQAWQILDLARVLFEKQLANAAAAPAEKPAEEPTPADAPVDGHPTVTPDTTDSPAPLSADESKNIKTMLADVFDLLGEVSLESESFPQAAKDFKSSLALKLELYEPHATYIAEAHFKLALALEFSAAGETVTDDEAKKLRDEAAEHIEKAIDSCRARIAKEEAKLEAANGDTKGKGVAKSNAEIDDMKDMMKELEQRLHDLRNPAPQPSLEKEMEPFRGLLGELLGEDPAVAKKRMEQAMSNAQDLSGLVRKKKPQNMEAEVRGSSSGAAKRKAEDDEELAAESDSNKKAKVEGEETKEGES